MFTYEQRLSQDRRWARREGSLHFEKEGAVYKSLTRIVKCLTDLGIPYAVAGGMALFEHGYRRFTEDVDLLVTREGLKKIHTHLEGLGYVPPFAGSKNLRDADSGVRIKFLITGEFPGDGLPKPVAFPDPNESSVELDGIRYLTLPKLIELKLALGLTNPMRQKDIVDVQELIQILKLPPDLADQLNPFVRDKYRELWKLIVESPSQPE